MAVDEPQSWVVVEPCGEKCRGARARLRADVEHMGSKDKGRETQCGVLVGLRLEAGSCWSVGQEAAVGL